MARQYYKRGWSHTKTRGKESTVTCSFCGRKVPKYKTFTVFKGFSIRDPVVKESMGEAARRGLNIMNQKMHACPACARHRNIVKKKGQKY